MEISLISPLPIFAGSVDTGNSIPLPSTRKIPSRSSGEDPAWTSLFIAILEQQRFPHPNLADLTEKPACDFGYEPFHVLVFQGNLKDNLCVVPLDGFSSSGPEGGPFTPTCKTYTLINDTNQPLNWETATTNDWLDITPPSGLLDRYSTTLVNVCLNDNANSLLQGFHSDALTFINTTSGNSHTRDIGLNVTPAMPAGAFYWFPMDTDPGWNTEGEWEFGVPLGQGSDCNDPSSGHTGQNVYGYNLAGNYSNNMPEYHLTTLRLNCTKYSRR